MTKKISKSQTSPKEKENNLIRGTTNIFIKEGNCIQQSFKKIQITSKRISSFTFPNVVAIQSLQFQMTTKKLRGHSCMVHKDNTWKLFFVWDYSTVNEGYIIGYEYTGKILCEKDIISFNLSLLSGMFYWVNLSQYQFSKDILPFLEFPVIILEGNYFGNHTPSRIQLPFPSPEYLIQLKGKYDQPLTILSSQTSVYNEVLDEFGYYDITLKHPSYYMNPDIYQKRKRASGKNKFPKIFDIYKNVTLPYLTIFLPNNYVVPYQDYLKSSQFLISVPFAQSQKPLKNHPFCTIDYALVKNEDICKLHNKDVKEYNDILEKSKYSNLLCINQQ